MYRVKFRSLGKDVEIDISNATFKNAQRLKARNSTNERATYLILLFDRDDEGILVLEENCKKVKKKVDKKSK